MYVLTQNDYSIVWSNNGFWYTVITKCFKKYNTVQVQLMKKFCIFLTILSIQTLTKSYNTSLLYNLQSLQTDYIFQQNNAYGVTIKNAFKNFYTTSKNSDASSLLKNNNIAQLFLLSPHRSDDNHFNDCIKSTQNIMLVYLYAKIFNDYVTDSEKIVEQVLCALEYWKKESFYHQLAIFRKHPIYWSHSPKHKKLVQSRIKILEKLKEDATLLLGIALHGRYQLSTITEQSEIFTHLASAKKPLNKVFCMPECDYTASNNSSLQDTIWLHESMTEQLKNFSTILSKHSKPHHFIEHGFFYSCLATAIIASYATYKINEDVVPAYKKKSIEAWNYFVKEYIQAPVTDLKDALWEQKNQSLTPFKKPKDLLLDNSWKTWLVDNRINHLFVWVNEIVNNVFDGGNDNLAKINTAIKQQQLTMAIAAISPVIIGTYASYLLTNHTYNKYIKHETWYRPMKLIVREIDKILNKLTTQNQISYADDGMLHALTLQLETYTSCLPNEELQLIQEDLKELSDYKISYAQKLGVLSRMYKTYEFLN